MPLKEYKVTLYPRPRTYSVMAETEMQASAIADMNYTSEAPSLTDVAYRHDVQEIIEKLQGREDVLKKLQMI